MSGKIKLVKMKTLRQLLELENETLTEQMRKLKAKVEENPELWNLDTEVDEIGSTGERYRILEPISEDMLKQMREELNPAKNI